MRKLCVITRASARLSTASPFTGFKFGGAAVWLGLFAALLYAFSQAYSNSYYRTYGVAFGLFEDSWHRAIFAGSVYVSGSLFTLLTAMLAAAIFYFLAALVLGWISRTRLPDAGEKMFGDLAKRLGIQHANPVAMAGVGIACVAIAVLLCAVTLYVLPLIALEKQGATRAKKEIEMIRTNDLNAMSAAGLSELKIERMEGTTSFVDAGISIGCQTNVFCVIRKKDKTVIIPLKNVVKMESTLIVAP
jgi:hypothetical protein